MVLIDTEEVVESPHDLLRVLSVLKNRPVVVNIKREIFEAVEPFLRKDEVLYREIEGDAERASVIMLYPEHLVKIHRLINQKSYNFADPELIAYALKNSEFLAIETIDSPLALVRCVRKHCKTFYKLIMLLSSHQGMRAYILCGQGTVIAAIAQEVRTEIGIKALRKIFYYGPYEALIYRIKHEQLV